MKLRIHLRRLRCGELSELMRWIRWKRGSHWLRWRKSWRKCLIELRWMCNR